MERRELFKSFTKPFKKEDKKEVLFRPPYYSDESAFLSGCVNCDGVCSSVCEEGIIKIAKDKTPYLDFNSGGCTYCDKCAIKCPQNVLDIQYKKYIDMKVEISTQNCLSWNNTMCFSCKDPCLDNAIDFYGMFKPVINDNCTACGFCLSVCPTTAITISKK